MIGQNITPAERARTALRLGGQLDKGIQACTWTTSNAQGGVTRAQAIESCARSTTTTRAPTAARPTHDKLVKADGVFLLFGYDRQAGLRRPRVAKVAERAAKMPFFGPMAGSDPICGGPFSSPMVFHGACLVATDEEFRALMAWGQLTSLGLQNRWRSSHADSMTYGKAGISRT